MSDEVFSWIEKYFHKVSFVDLTGWGEPLLDKKIFERIKKVRSYNVPVRIISNGTLLNENNIEGLLDSGLTNLSISFDGGTEDTYEAIRKGASYRKVIDNIRMLVKLRDEGGSPLKISAEIVVMKQNSDELDAFVQDMSEIGVDSLGMKPLNVLWSEDMTHMRLDREVIAGKIKDVQARNRKVKLNCWDIYKDERPVNDCLAGAAHTVFISWDGYVSPCCNLGHPVSRLKMGDNRSAIRNTRYNLGNIKEKSLDDIWNSAEYVSFKNDLRKGALPRPCVHCNIGPVYEKPAAGSNGKNTHTHIPENNVFKEKDNYYHCERPDILRLIPSFIKRVLDIGCAGGSAGATLKKRQDCEVVGVELVESVAEEARGKLDNVITGNIESVIEDLPDNYFDCLVMSDVIEHLKDPWSALAKLKTKLVEDAVLVCSIPNVRYWPILKGVIEGKWEYEDEGVLDKTHLRFFTKNSMYDLLDKAGFEIMKIDGNTDDKETVPHSLITAFGDAGYDVGGLEEESRVVQYLFSAIKREHVERTLSMHESASLTQEQYNEFIELGENMFGRGDIEGAKGIFQSLLKIDKGNAMVCNNLGVISIQTGDLGEAKNLFRRTLALDPENEEAKQNLEIIEGSHNQPESPSVSNEKVHQLRITKIGSYEDFRSYALYMQSEYVKRENIERSFIKGTEPFAIQGYCFVCKKYEDFYVDYLASSEINGLITPNWRERLVCPSCMLPNRMRASIQLFEQMLKPDKDAGIYITEQVTPFYRWLLNNYTNVAGSEYLGDRVPWGMKDEQGIRNESMTSLTFNDEQFDFILSFDVLEHIPDFRRALRECCRVLKPGGSLLFSVPFTISDIKNTVRAFLNEAGQVEHVMPPQYHGDPLIQGGCLTFQTFGWEMLDHLKEEGFQTADAFLYWSEELGYLGREQIAFVASKGKTVTCKNRQCMNERRESARETGLPSN
jgi:MoaA/NifB/PqqE/SkfB family radical SAM enzyme/SAM-dependent methyltransferase